MYNYISFPVPTSAQPYITDGTLLIRQQLQLELQELNKRSFSKIDIEVGNFWDSSCTDEASVKKVKYFFGKWDGFYEL